MINTRMMYLRPENMFKDFIIERNSQVVTGTGRVASCRSGNGTETLRGCLAEASDEERQNHSQKDHVVTHTIVQAGGPEVKRTDRLVLTDRAASRSRSFYIVDIDDTGSLGISTIYYAEERRDMG